jgi:hypothetical protein
MIVYVPVLLHSVSSGVNLVCPWFRHPLRLLILVVVVPAASSERFCQ